MKKQLLLFSYLVTAISFSQSISVSNTNYTVPQLVNNILINSPCVNATNISWRTGTNYGSTNGIGFFQNTNSNFPMQSGVILTTGNALSAVGPNTTLLSDGSMSWDGDSSLETTLAASGISMISKNATVIEFDFIPVSSQFSFEFLFASEEYGNFQCQFSDAFAFLLTNTNTGVTTNLAVVPSTNQPISVVTIRDFLYNSSCPSANPQLFGSFNGGSAANTSATNFNGQTKLLTASSILTPGTSYHIKLVIADRLDNESDSAIFINSNTFNIGQEPLGLDLTQANGNGLCHGTTHTITTAIDPATHTFEWKKDGVILASETGPNLIISQPGTYSLTFVNTLGTCQPITDEVIIEYFPNINAATPSPIYRCDNGSSSYLFNIGLNTPIVKVGLDPNAIVTYHASQADADTNNNPLPLQYSSTPGATVYVRIQLPNSNCFVTRSFQLLISSSLQIGTLPDLHACARSPISINASFNLSLQNPLVLNGQSPALNIISYHTSLANATNGISPINNTLNALFSNRIIYVRLQNVSDSSCFTIASFNLIVDPAPPVDDLDDVIVCAEYILPPLVDGNYFTASNGNGIPLFEGNSIIQTSTIHIYNQPGGPGTCGSNTSFRVTIVDPDSLLPDDVISCGSYTLPTLQYGKYYSSPGGQGSEIPAGTVITSSQLIYYYFITTEPPICSVDESFTVTILPSISLINQPNVFDCVSYTLPPLSSGNYYSLPGGQGEAIPSGTVITQTQTLYIYVNGGTAANCIAEDTFQVIIGLPTPQNISQCNGYPLPALPIGNYYFQPNGLGSSIPAGTVINSNSIIYIYIPNTNGTTNCTNSLSFTVTISQPYIDTVNDVTVCESYTLPNITNGEYRTGINGTGTLLYPGDLLLNSQTVYIFRRLDATCFNQNSFTVTINPLPQIDSRSDIDICDQYILTNLTVGNYFTGPNGTGTQLSAGDIITTSQRIYIYATTNTTPPCFIENSFQINLFSTQADSIQNVNTCDSYILPVLNDGNHYYTQTGGPNGTGTEVPPGTVIASSQTLYIFKESIIRVAFSCIDETSFVITINNTPVIAPIPNVNVCESYTLPALTNGNYFTGANGTGTQLAAGTVINNTQTIHVYASTNTVPNCSTSRSFVVTIYNVDEIPDVTICENFTLPVLAVGNYYTGPNGTGSMLIAGTVISTSSTLYVHGNAPFLPRCSDESSFTVTIIPPPSPRNVPLVIRTVCDEDGINDGITNFDLTSLTAAVLGNQTGSQFSVVYFNSILDAQNNNNPITTSTATTVYVRVNNNLAPNCFDVKPISLIVNKLPETNPQNGYVCIDNETGALLNSYTIFSGLTSAQHTFIWKDENGSTVGTGSSYTATQPGNYSLTATHNVTGCSSVEATVTVSQSEPAEVTFDVQDDFQDSQSIIVTATGQGGDYEYQLNNGPFQDSNIFTNVISGIHYITVRDKNGCGTTTIQAIVVNYPKFFTPNGDGYHDTWNIKDLSNQPSALISIFDRYGKMLKQIRPNGQGWDGSYNGSQMISDDYWFVVNYTDENQNPREFKSHFAMKR